MTAQPATKHRRLESKDLLSHMMSGVLAFQHQICEVRGVGAFHQHPPRRAGRRSSHSDDEPGRLHARPAGSAHLDRAKHHSPRRLDFHWPEHRRIRHFE